MTRNCDSFGIRIDTALGWLDLLYKLRVSSRRCDEFKKKYDSWEGSASRLIILDLLKLLKKNGHSAKGVRDQVRAEFNAFLAAKCASIFE